MTKKYAQSSAKISINFFFVSAKWLGLTVFEMLLHVLSVFIFTILLTLKIDEVFDLDWFTVFAPLFICDVTNLYFRLIAYFRLFMEVPRENVFFIRICKTQGIAFAWFIFKLFLFIKLSSSDVSFSWIVVFAPLHVLMTGLVFCSCELRTA